MQLALGVSDFKSCVPAHQCISSYRAKGKMVGRKRERGGEGKGGNERGKGRGEGKEGEKQGSKEGGAGKRKGKEKKEGKGRLRGAESSVYTSHTRRARLRSVCQTGSLQGARTQCPLCPRVAARGLVTLTLLSFVCGNPHPTPPQIQAPMPQRVRLHTSWFSCLRIHRAEPRPMSLWTNS